MDISWCHHSAQNSPRASQLKNKAKALTMPYRALQNLKNNLYSPSINLFPIILIFSTPALMASSLFLVYDRHTPDPSSCILPGMLAGSLLSRGLSTEMAFLSGVVPGHFT